MTTDAESVQPDLDQRTIRTATEFMSVIEKARALFHVVSQSGKTYTVDLAEPACTCGDFTYRDEVNDCKHIRRVRSETGQIGTDRLEVELAATANELEISAEQLEIKARDLRPRPRVFTRLSSGFMR